jgi:hypothetical protein
MVVNLGFVIPFGPKPVAPVAVAEPLPAPTPVADCSTMDDDHDGVNNCADTDSRTCLRGDVSQRFTGVEHSPSIHDVPSEQQLYALFIVVGNPPGRLTIPVLARGGRGEEPHEG